MKGRFQSQEPGLPSTLHFMDVNAAVPSLLEKVPGCPDKMRCAWKPVCRSCISVAQQGSVQSLFDDDEVSWKPLGRIKRHKIPQNVNGRRKVVPSQPVCVCRNGLNEIEDEREMLLFCPETIKIFYLK